MIRQTKEAMVSTMGVKMQAKRPSLPILAVGGGRYSIKQCRGWGVNMIYAMGVERCSQVDGQTNEYRVGGWV